jgi:hypothetical protein
MKYSKPDFELHLRNHEEDKENLNRHGASKFSKRSSITKDASLYYKRYDDDGKNNNESQSLMDHPIAECYLSFSKLLQSEMRHLDKRESTIL